MTIKKRGVFLVLIVYILLFSVMSSEVEAGCCIDQCQPATDPQECTAPENYVDDSCGEVLQCQQGCCTCSSESGSDAQYVSESFCGTAEEQVCFGYTEADFYSEVSEAQCTAGLFGTISGFVRDKETGEPVSGAEVTILPDDKTVSTVNGAYGVGDIAPGTIDIIVSAPGYFTNSSTLEIFAQEEKTYNIVLSKATANKISGTITSGGNALSDAIVTLLPIYEQFITDSNGEYTFTPIPFKEYIVIASNQTYTDASKEVPIGL